jgi:hypothetical protein
MRDKMSFFGINMARRGNRRWLVAVTYLGLALFWALVWRLAGSQGESISFSFVLIATSLLVNGIIFGGYGRWGLIKPFNNCTPSGAPAPWHNDERELHRRDRMHYYSHRVVVCVLCFAYVFAVTSFQNPHVSRALMLVGLVLGLTLPQALLLWIEPDMEFEETEARSA